MCTGIIHSSIDKKSQNGLEADATITNIGLSPKAANTVRILSYDTYYVYTISITCASVNTRNA